MLAHHCLFPHQILLTNSQNEVSSLPDFNDASSAHKIACMETNSDSWELLKVCTSFCYLEISGLDQYLDSLTSH